MTSAKTSSLNNLLVLAVGLLVGLIGGYFFGLKSPNGIPSGAFVAQANAVECPHSLDEHDRYILAGFRCPATPDIQAVLLDCHCAVAHAIMDEVKSDLELGKDGMVIRDEIIAEYGDRLKFAGQ